VGGIRLFLPKIFEIHSLVLVSESDFLPPRNHLHNGDPHVFSFLLSNRDALELPNGQSLPILIIICATISVLWLTSPEKNKNRTSQVEGANKN